MPDQVTLTGRVLATRRIRGEWGALELATGAATVRCTGDIAHLSKGDEVQALGRWVASKYDRIWTGVQGARRAAARAAAGAGRDRGGDRSLPAAQAVTRRRARAGDPARQQRRGDDEAHNPFLPVVDPDREVKGWGYGSAAQYADLVGIPADAEVRAVAAVEHLWQQLSDGSVVVSRDRLESRITTAAGIDAYGGAAVGGPGGARRAPGADGAASGGVARDARAEREIAEWIRRRMAA